MTFNELARKRYSCRKLAAKSVEQEKLDAIIEAGILAPTGIPLEEANATEFRKSSRAVDGS